MQKLQHELSLSKDLGRVLLGIGVYIWNDEVVRALLKELRNKGFDGKIVLGGPQISFLEAGRPEKEYPEADLFLRGYAEESLPQSILTGVVPCEFSTCRLKDLPSPILEKVQDLSPGRFMHWETQRGCPFSCSFCQYRNPVNGKSLKYFSWDRIRQEIRMIVDAGVADIKIVDPIFHHNPLANELLNELKRLEYTGKIACECRFETIKDEFLNACERLNITLDFGLQTVIKQEWMEIKRPNNLKKIEATIHTLHQRGLKFTASIIYGLPLQTLESFQKTVDFCHSHSIPRILAFPLCVYPGTELEKDQNRWGLEVELVDGFPTVVKSNTMSRADNRKMKEIADLLDQVAGFS